MCFATVPGKVKRNGNCGFSFISSSAASKQQLAMQDRCMTTIGTTNVRMGSQAMMVSADGKVIDTELQLRVFVFLFAVRKGQRARVKHAQGGRAT